jgi:UDPglucose 6-dehydrogenase
MPVLFDGRNIYDGKQLAELGLLYRGIGRPALGRCMASAA